VLGSVAGPNATPLGQRPPSSGDDAPLTVPPRAGSGHPPGAPDQGNGDADEPVSAKQRGVALGMFAEDVGFSYTPLLREIAALGATHVSLVVPIY